MKLTVVGCTGSMSGPSAPASCYLVQARGIDEVSGKDRTFSVVLDLGPGAFGQLWRYMDVRKIDALLLSHTHADHMGDIISMHVHRKWHPDGPLGPVMLAAPDGVLDRVRGIDGARPEEQYEGEFAPFTLENEGSFQVGPLRITPYSARHTVPAFGFRIEGPAEEEPGNSVSLAYTGDTDTCATITQMARGVDLLLSEAGFTDADEPRGIHLTGERAGQLAREAQVKTMVLTHIQPWTEGTVVLAEACRAWDGPLSVAYAGATYEL
ncbi:MBL fold metallo-hydrolase [Gleimia hominis]|uniref:MBL fold metallo-hydrolase n=1 Tax=Gleimia hominis TaxID=595468 RepID=A0ABU3IBQ8_9ACTO|nr:MBL fold metallo-hydrolase [Gleimia hominis]MDT3767815.1 MBL fold metallo-hydrolase [Gleimia hominis]